jgi:hypothetical protein
MSLIFAVAYFIKKPDVTFFHFWNAVFFIGAAYYMFSRYSRHLRLYNEQRGIKEKAKDEPYKYDDFIPLEDAN